MLSVLVIFAALAAIVAGQGQLYFNHDATAGENVVYDFTTPENLYIALKAYPCSAASCSAGTCTHPYCATNSGGACTSADETWTTSVGPVAFAFACCSGTTIDTCGKPPTAGGFVTLTSVTG